MIYPGHIVRAGEKNLAIVQAIADAMVKRGYPPLSPAGTYDRAFASVVKLYQAQNVDVAGRPLKVDGEVGPMTWGSLFGADIVSVTPTGLAGAALGVAVSQIGIMEDPPGSNRGPRVNQYLASTGIPGGCYWCMAFVYWCFEQAAPLVNSSNLFPKTAGCLSAWSKTKAKYPGKIITRAQAIANPGLVRPGLVFILDYGQGMGHTGFVTQSMSGGLKTVEGNTNEQASGNGVGVFALNRRKVMDANLKGFLDFS